MSFHATRTVTGVVTRRMTAIAAMLVKHQKSSSAISALVCSTGEFWKLILDVLPRFDTCDSTAKNAMCRAKCPGNTYARTRYGETSVMATKCACKGSSCLWTLGKKPVDDLFCISTGILSKFDFTFTF